MTPTASRVDHSLISLIGLALTLSLASGCNYIDAMDDESTPLPEKRTGEIPATAFVLTKLTDTDKQPSGWWSGCRNSAGHEPISFSCGRCRPAVILVAPRALAGAVRAHEYERVRQ